MELRDYLRIARRRWKLIISTVLVVVAVVRAVLPVGYVGPLAVRGRALDVAVAAAMAVGLLVVAEGIPL